MAIISAFSGLLVVVAATFLIIGLAVGKGPSDADLFARAQAGDREAGEILEAKYAEPEPLGAAELTKAGFTPGTYIAPNIDARDGAEIVASFILFAVQGRVNEAMEVSGNPKSEELRDLANNLIGFSLNEQNEITEVTVPATLFDPSQDFDVVRESVRSNHTYSTTTMEIGILFLIERGNDGRWKLLGAN